MQIQSEGLISVQEAAEELDRHKQTIFKYIKEGELQSEMINRRRFVFKEDVERIKSEWQRAESEELITIQEAAEMLDKTQGTIYKYCQDERLDWEKIGGNTYIHKASIDEFEYPDMTVPDVEVELGPEKQELAEMEEILMDLIGNSDSKVTNLISFLGERLEGGGIINDLSGSYKD